LLQGKLSARRKKCFLPANFRWTEDLDTPTHFADGNGAKEKGF